MFKDYMKKTNSANKLIIGIFLLITFMTLSGPIKSVDLGLIINNNSNNNYSDNVGDVNFINNESNTALESSATNNSSNYPLIRENAAQFNVSEYVTYTTPNNDIQILNEYLSFGIPTNWMCTYMKTYVPSAFTVDYPLKSQNNDFTISEPHYKWEGATTKPWYEGIPPQQSWVNFTWGTYNSSNGKAEIIYNYGGLSGDSTYYGFYYHDNNSYNHAGDNVEIGELFEPEKSVFPIENDFSSDPNYQILQDPYGNDSKDSQTTAIWDASHEALVTSIDSANSIFKIGDPSIAFLTAFYIPFEADRVTITFAWSVINKGYEDQDKFSVISRIDNTPIDGRYGAEGEYYSDASEDALEYDDNPSEIPSHGYWERSYDISNLLGPLGDRAGYHSLDFGCYLEEPDEGDDDVDVYWDYIIINATHYDWYTAAIIDFDYIIENLNFLNSANGSDDIVFSMYAGDPYGNMGRYIINKTSDLKFGNWSDRVHVKLKIPHTLMAAFEVDYFRFAIGLEYIGLNPGTGSVILPFKYKLHLDNIKISVNYIVKEDPLLEYRIIELGEPWQPFATDFNRAFVPPISLSSFNMEFRATNPSYAGKDLHLRLFGGILVQKYIINGAKASFYLESFSNSTALWNITYNNTQSVNEFDDLSLINNTFYEYNFTIENIPAHDGLGENSTDWYLYALYAPNGDNASDIVDKWSKNPFYQNITVVNATTGAPGHLLRGVWRGYAYQNNYVLNGTLAHNGLGSPNIFYENDNSFVNLSVRNSTNLSDSECHYQLMMYNSSSENVTGFPAYSNGRNITYPWIVVDQGVGLYILITIWNHTNTNGQTTRFGWYRDYFYIYRKTEGRVISSPGPVLIGETAEYIVEYNMSVGGSSIGIEGATIIAFNNETNHRWGTDWPPYQYLLDYLIYLGNGQYKIGLKTDGVPVDNYTIYFHMIKGFYDLNNTEVVDLNITVTIPLKEMTVTYISGAFNVSDTQGYLTPDNIPYVNDTSNFIIQFQLNETGGNIIRDAYVTAKFNSSENVMVAIEVYAYTHLEKDKGIYNLTLDTTNLNSTTNNPLQYNYTLEIAFVADGYLTRYQNITASIKPLPLSLEPTSIDNMYEGNNFDIKVSTSIVTLSGNEPYTNLDVYYSLYNTSGYIKGGSLPNTISNIFETTIDISLKYLYPGDYWIIFNASGLNVETSYSDQVNFTIYSKLVSNMTLTFPDEIRIGAVISISVKLFYINSTPIPNQDITLTINYSATYSYQVVVTTSSEGKGIYELSIPQYYKGNNLSVLAEYAGTDIIFGCSAFKYQEILGKIPVNITIVNPPQYVQVGYNATYTANLSILNEQNYNGKLLYLFGFYDDNSQPFLVRELTTNENGTATYTIPEIEDGHSNLTIYFEFLGDEKTEHQINSTISYIIPKWNTTINVLIDSKLNKFPDIVRKGQTLQFNISLNPVESNFTEHLSGMLLQIKFEYLTDSNSYAYFTENHYTDINNTVIFSYEIPDNYKELNITITFGGTNKIKGSNLLLQTNIAPKKQVIFDILTKAEGELLLGTYFYSLDISDDEGLPLENVEIFFKLYDENDKLIDQYSAITNINGSVSVSIDLTDLDPGSYYIVIEFPGIGIYQSYASEPIELELTTRFLIFVSYLPIIGAILAAILLGIFIIYRTVVIPARIRKMEALKAIHQRFEDAENIQYILILFKESGLAMFSRSFANIPIDGDLISGFLSAISSFGEEIGDKMEKKKETTEKGLEQLSYKQFKIIVNDVALVRTALLLIKDASPSLKNKLKKFNLAFQEKFMNTISNWNGQSLPEGPIMELIEKHLEVDLLYPHNINLQLKDKYLKTIDKKSIERLIIEEASKPKFNNTFRIREMINHLTVLGKKEIMIFNGIDTLRREKIVFAINPRTQYLIDQFRPIINKLSKDARKILIAISEGITQESKLRKVKGISNLDENIAILQQMNLINSRLEFTEIGDAIVTLMKLIPDF
ncbi:MAG: carboxypeptidase-like regulatory domain-containing protein [Promethearchaeota archaeon]